VRIPKHWVRVERDGVASWGSSDQSDEHARADGEVRLGRILAWLRDPSGDEPRYPYADRPLREPILQEVDGRDGRRIAVVTRNAYGCRVLNTSTVMMLDIDLPPPSSRSWWQKLKGTPQPESPESTAMGHVQRYVDRHPDFGVRLYRTRAGLRGIVTHATFDPTVPSTQSILEELRCDPLYVKLCKAQECFRARLDPKPWRIGLAPPKTRYPHPNDEARVALDRWVATFEDAARAVRVCRFVGRLGASAVAPDATRIIDLHDDATCATTNEDLA
jgi:hypothetical protein